MVKLKSIARFEKIAAERGEGVDDLVSKMIDVLSTEKTLIGNLIDDDEPGPKKKRKLHKPVTNTRIDDRGED